MTKRKPPGATHESWVERLIDEARERGEFEDLPGRGKPLPDLDQAYDPSWWIKGWLRREGFSVLPPELELRRQVERFLEGIASLGTEKAVRTRIKELNERIRTHNATITSGPATSLAGIDADDVVRHWRRLKEGP